MKRVTFDYTLKTPRRTRNRLRRAWKALAVRQGRDEKRYTEAVLDLNHLGVLFRPNGEDSDVDLGRKCRDLLYGFWWEEDLRLRLAAELLAFDDCQVHGQVHIRTKVRKKARRRIHQMRESRYPDLLLIATKRKERTSRSTERNLETAAVELKHFGKGRPPAEMRKAMQRDLKKLLGYCRPRSTPRADVGYFFCIDETGQAGELLENLFLLKCFRKRPLGYGVVVPSWVHERLPFPGDHGYLDVMERRVSFILALVGGELEGIAFDRNANIRLDEPTDYYGMSLQMEGRARGRIEVCWPGYVEGVNRRYLPVMLRLRKRYLGAVRKFSERYAWNKDKKRYVPSDRAVTTVLLTKIRRSHLNSMRGIRQEAQRITGQLRQVIGRVR